MTTQLSKAETRILEQFGPPESDRLDWRGKNADLLIVKGDLAARINDVENVQLVFKDGARCDSQKHDSAKGHYGRY